MRRRALLLAAVSLVACEGKLAPVDPYWGKQACADCGMLVSEKRFAAQLVDAQGERLYFDDVGCLVHRLEVRPVDTAASWVRHSAAERWLPLAEARFEEGAKTPMDYGFAASEEGRLGIDDVRSKVRARAKGGEQ